MRGQLTTLRLIGAAASLAAVLGLAADPAAAAGPGVSPSPPGVVVHDDVVYGTDNGQALKLDEYLPASRTGPVPAVIVIHGGGWTGGNRTETKFVAIELARSGFEAFNIGYRLAGPGATGYPGEVSDAEEAVSWVQDNAAHLGVEPTEIGALGASAGGNLALELGTLRRDPSSPAPFVKAVVSWSGPTNLVPLAHLGLRSCRPLRACPRGSLRGFWYWSLSEYLGCNLAHCTNTLRQASPVTHVRLGGAPLMVWNSTEELVPLSQVVDLVRRAHAIGEPVAVDLVPGHLHATQYTLYALGQTIAFLHQQLGT